MRLALQPLQYNSDILDGTMEYGGNETMSNEMTNQETVLYKLIKRYSSVNTYYNLLRQARGHIITERNGMERNKTFI